MREFETSIAVKAPVERVFRAYVENTDHWWPRIGTYRYSFAGPGREQVGIHFEPKLGGRLYEIYDDESEYEIGRITVWDPPNTFTYTWRDPSWPSGETEVEISFESLEAGVTLVRLRQSGFGKGGVPAIAEGYQTGQREILHSFNEWIESEKT